MTCPHFRCKCHDSYLETHFHFIDALITYARPHVKLKGAKRKFAY